MTRIVRGMFKQSIWFAVAVAFIALANSMAFAQVQVPKSGKVSLHYGWKSQNEIRDLGKGMLIFIGEDHGAGFNDAGSGFLHNSAITCPHTGYLGASGLVFRGNCYITDADGDIVILLWECERPAKGPGPQEGRCAGAGRFLGGTGKYEGITGKIEFHGGTIGKGPHGYSIWNGEYKIP